MARRSAKVIWNGREIDLAARPAAPGRNNSRSRNWRQIAWAAAGLVLLVAMAATALPPVFGCNIKGNASDGGERIYHVLGQDYYQKTRISYLRGERWFCSEAAARAAGWRRALR